jgi:Ca-activated chloride channel family protein
METRSQPDASPGAMQWLTLLLVTAVAAWAQQNQPFRTKAHEVVVPVTVTTRHGKAVESLTAADFSVLNDGKPQTVRLLSHDSDGLPIYAVLVLQTNGGAEAALAKIKKTASIISTYITNDMGTGQPSYAAVITVSDDVNITQNFTADADTLHDVFGKLAAKGDSGRLLDGVNLACDMLAAKPRAARRIIILVSESRDRQSKTHFADVVTKAQRNEIAIYSISYSAYLTPFTQKASDVPPPPDEPGLYDPASGGGGFPILAIPLELARLAKVNIAKALPEATGGEHETFTTLRGLELQLTAIGTEIHNRYTLTFVLPEPQAPGYHRLAVTVRGEEDWRVHARNGYWSSEE